MRDLPTGMELDLVGGCGVCDDIDEGVGNRVVWWCGGRSGVVSEGWWSG
jgi:hypothetical protein